MPPENTTPVRRRVRRENTYGHGVQDGAQDGFVPCRKQGGNGGRRAMGAPLFLPTADLVAAGQTAGRAMGKKAGRPLGRRAPQT